MGRTIAAAAAAAGLVVVSGMARGLDAVAQTAALDAGGLTLGVLGNGLGVIYPAAKRALYQRVLELGLLLTEFPPGERPVVGSFPRRNRLISGLARVTVVIEAAAGSGTLITVAAALEQGRDVMAVPGEITSPTSVRTNRLLRDGAEPLLEVAGLFPHYPELGEVAAAPAAGGQEAEGAPLPGLTPEEASLFRHLAAGPPRAQCAMVFGNPDMTFAEMETWCKTQIPPVPVPNIKFMGTALDKEDANSVCFSLENTPNVVIADSVRASMSFPGAFKKFPVRQKNTAGELEELGNFADGGILNNYPLDQLSTPATAHSAYTLPKVHNIDGKLESMNPGAYGLSLTTHVQDTNKHKTGFSESKRLKKLKGRPIDDRESARLEEAEKQEEAFKARQVAAQAQKGGAFKKIAHVLRKNFMGDTPTSIKDNLKKRVFKNQTVLIYTEGVATLEFQVSPKKKELIEASGKIAFINWFIEHRDPTQNYDDFFKKTHQGKAEENSYDPKKFSGDAVLDQEDNEFISQNIVPTNQQESLPDIKKYVRCMIDFHDELNNVRKIQKYLSKSELMDELIEDQKEKLAKFSDINNNQRLKHLAWQLKQLEVKPEFKKNTQIKKQAIELIKARKIRHAAKKQALKDNSKKNISIEELVEKIHAHLANDQRKDTQLALTIFKGQLSNVFKLMRSDPTLLSKLAERCDADQLQELLENIGRTAEQLEQQDRVFHQNYGLLAKLERETFENFNARFALYLTTVTDPSLLTQAILQQDSKKIAYLLSRSYINPLETSNDGKNALHACVERADVDTFEKIIKQFNCRDLSYDTQGNTILHYIIHKSNPDFIHKLLEKPKIKAWIKDLQKNDPEAELHLVWVKH